MRASNAEIETMDRDEQPLETYEARFLRRIKELSGKPMYDPLSSELEALAGGAGDSGQEAIYVNPNMIENYARTQRAADKLNEKMELDEEIGKTRWYGCTCGRLHQSDPKTGKVDTGWY